MPVVALAVRYPQGGMQLLAGGFVGFFEVYAIDADGVNIDVTDKAVWTSSNEEIMRRSAGSGRTSGAFFPAAAGTAAIRATYAGLSDELAVTVLPPATPPYLLILTAGISNTPSLIVFLRTNSQLSQAPTGDVTWTSSHPKLGVVSNGIFKPLSAGNLELQATYNGVSTTYWISAAPITWPY